MAQEETISKMNLRFIYIVNDFFELGEPVSEKNQVRKILRSLPNKYYFKRNVTQDVHDITALMVVALCGNLWYMRVKDSSRVKRRRRALLLQLTIIVTI